VARFETRFQEGNRLYEEGQYPEAAGVYQQMLNQGALSSTLFFNLGNACYKNGQIGRARAFYWMAHELNPRARDVRSNLRFIARSAGPEPGGRWNRIVSRLRFFSLNEWTIWFSAGLWLWLGLLAAAHWQPSWRLRLRPFRVVVVGFLILAGVGFLLTLQDRYGTSRAVVVAPTASIRRGPLPESQAVCQLQDGAMVQVADQQNEWLMVVDAAGRSGWLQDREVVRLQPGTLATNLF
jgi:tetratricopeptide (TPR) repeat protein